MGIVLYPIREMLEAGTLKSYLTRGKRLGLSRGRGARISAHNPAVLQLNNAVAKRSVSLRMGHLNNRCTRFVEPLEQLHDFFSLRRMEVARRLVSENELRVHDQGARHGDKLLLSAGKLAREKVFLADDLKAVERIAHQAGTLFVRHVLIGERDIEVLEHREIVNQVVALKHKSDVALVQLVALLDVELVHRLVEEVILAAPGAVEHPDDAQKRGFTRARGPHNGDKLARQNVQVDAPQHEELATSLVIGLFQTAQLN